MAPLLRKNARTGSRELPADAKTEGTLGNDYCRNACLSRRGADKRWSALFAGTDFPGLRSDHLGRRKRRSDSGSLPALPVGQSFPNGCATRTPGLVRQSKLVIASANGRILCYRQHDDTTTPDFFEVLTDCARERPAAAGIYTDCQWMGGRTDLETAPSIEGDVLVRLRQHIEQKEPVAVRGIFRREAIEQAGLVRGDEFRGLSEVFVWLAKLLRWGSFIRVPQATLLPA